MTTNKIQFKTTSIFLLLIGVLLMCKKEPKDPMKQEFYLEVSDRTYKRDKQLVKESVQQLIDEEYRLYELYTEMYHKGKVKIYVDSIFYSPDTLKMFAFAIAKKEEADQGTYQTSAPVYGGWGLIGYRESSEQIWNLYPFDKFYAEAGTYKKTTEKVRKQYTENISGNGVYIYNDQKDKVVLKLFKYNVDEIGFWYIYLWEKGHRIPGLYTFETDKRNTLDIDNIFYQKRVPDFTYSDSLTALYYQ